MRGARVVGYGCALVLLALFLSLVMAAVALGW